MGPIHEKVDADETFEDNDMFEELSQEEVITTPTDDAIEEFINEESNESQEANNQPETTDNIVEEELNKIYDDEQETLNDSDLFNLIDSMYEDGDEE